LGRREDAANGLRCPGRYRWPPWPWLTTPLLELLARLPAACLSARVVECVRMDPHGVKRMTFKNFGKKTALPVAKSQSGPARGWASPWRKQYSLLQRAGSAAPPHRFPRGGERTKPCDRPVGIDWGEGGWAQVISGGAAAPDWRKAQRGQARLLGSSRDALNRRNLASRARSPISPSTSPGESTVAHLRSVAALHPPPFPLPLGAAGGRDVARGRQPLSDGGRHLAPLSSSTAGHCMCRGPRSLHKPAHTFQTFTLDTIRTKGRKPERLWIEIDGIGFGPPPGKRGPRPGPPTAGHR